MKHFTKVALVIVLVLVILGSVLCAVGIGIGFSISELRDVYTGEFSLGFLRHIPFIRYGNDDGWEDWESVQEGEGFGWASAADDTFGFPWENLDEIKLDVDNASVSIVQNAAEDSGNIRLDVEYRKENHQRKVKASMSGSTLKIEDSDAWRIKNSDSVRITMWIPAQLSEQSHLKKIKLEQARGQIISEIPLTAKEISINVGAGECDIRERLTAEKKISLEVEAGRLSVGELEAEKVDISGGVGELTASLIQAEKIGIEGGVGSVQIKAAGKESDYSYDIDCGVGGVTIGNRSYSGLSAGETIKNQGSKEIEIDCGVGNVEVSFEEQ